MVFKILADCESILIFQILTEKLRCQKVSLDFSEFVKVDGNITSCVLLISKTSHAYRASADAGR